MRRMNPLDLALYLLWWTLLCYGVMARDWWFFALGAFAIHLEHLERQ